MAAKENSKNGEKMSSPPNNLQKNLTVSKLSSFGMFKLFSLTKLNLDNILLSEEKLQNPPSLSDGMHIDVERELRFLGCELIQAASILLKLPQETAMACVSLASKIEEAPRRIRDVVNVFYHMKQMQRHRDSRKISPMALDEKYVALKNEVIKAERRVLKELGFCVHVKHPHKLIVSYLKALDLEGEESLIQKAWNYMNDGLRTDLFLRYNTETIACACIFLAARVLDYPLPPAMFIGGNSKNDEKVTVRKWWELFDADEANILEACRILLKMYRRKSRPNWNKLEDEYRKLKFRLQETAAANKMSVRVENTPNPHATVGGSTTNVDKFSPQSRQQSPKASETTKSKNRGEKKEKDEKANGASSPYYRKRKVQTSTQEYQSKRKRHRSSSTESLRSSETVETSGGDKKKWLPKRYLPSANSYRSRVVADDREQQQQQQTKDVASSRDDKRLIRRSLSRSLSPNRRKKERKRSRSSSRVRREQEKREREVRLAIGKKEKSFSSSRHH